MILSKRGQAQSRHGLVLIYMSQGLKFLSIIKSNPNI